MGYVERWYYRTRGFPGGQMAWRRRVQLKEGTSLEGRWSEGTGEVTERNLGVRWGEARELACYNTPGFNSRPFLHDGL